MDDFNRSTTRPSESSALASSVVATKSSTKMRPREGSHWARPSSFVPPCVFCRKMVFPFRRAFMDSMVAMVEFATRRATVGSAGDITPTLQCEYSRLANLNHLSLLYARHHFGILPITARRCCHQHTSAEDNCMCPKAVYSGFSPTRTLSLCTANAVLMAH